jgi:hypothetical protein
MPTETVCPNCGGSGWKIIERADLSGAERCDCVFGERARRLEENAAIPPLYRNASFDNFALPRDNPIGLSRSGQRAAHREGLLPRISHRQAPGADAGRRARHR